MAQAFGAPLYEVIHKLGGTLRKARAICRKAGMNLCYHAFEFAPAAGGKLLDERMRTAGRELGGRNSTSLCG